MVNKKRGLTLIETLIAITVLLLAVVGVVGVMLNSRNVNEIARYQVIAKEIAQAEIERVKLMGYRGVTPANLTGTPTGIGYVANFQSLGGTYTFPGISGTAQFPPYHWVVFRAIDVTRVIKGKTMHYYYTLKLECEGTEHDIDNIEKDFVDGMAKRLRMRTYWLFNGRLKHIEVVFVVGRR